MRKLITPAILIIVSVIIFIMFVNPGYTRIKTLKNESIQYDEALNKSRELQAARDELLDQYNNFSTQDIDDLKKMVPDHVDNVRLIIEIDSIASQYGMVVRGAELSGSTKSDGGILSEPGPQKEEMTLRFSVISSYDSFVRFLSDLEHSLRIVDVERVSFVASEVDSNEYEVEVKTYWLSSDN